MSDEELLALSRAAAKGDALARARMERLLDRQPTEAVRAELAALEVQLAALFGAWWRAEPQARRLVARKLAKGRSGVHGNFWSARTGEVVWLGRPRATGSAFAVERRVLERWVRLTV